MFSNKKEYRVVTAYGGKFTVQHRYIENTLWNTGWPDYDTAEKAMELINELIDRDNFVPEIVDVRQS